MSSTQESLRANTIEVQGGSQSYPLEFRMENFRLFGDSDWLPIAPVTCVVGRNSSGKSSVIAALLLLKQSIENEVFGSAITPLALAGQYCDLGQFRDVVHDHKESSKISFSFRLATETLYERNRSYGPLVPIGTPRISKLGRDPYRLYSQTDFKSDLKGFAELRLTFSADQPFGPSLSQCEFSFSEVGTIRFTRTISGERRQHWRTYGSDTSKALVCRPTPRSFFPIITVRDQLYKSFGAGEKSMAQQLMLLCRNYFSYVEALLRSSEMIGPFRQPPERRYSFAGFGASRSGPNGEQAIDLLITESLLKKGKAQPLLSSVSYWLKELKLIDSLRVRDIAKKINLFEVDVKLSGSRIRTNLVDVGFGVSQVLPVIIQGLLMERGGIYFVQEPEIHLHPDAQAGLADFFIYLAFQGVTTVIETHSEYLLLRLRRRLAEYARPHSRALPALRFPHPAGFSASDVSFLFSHSASAGATISKLELGSGFQFENLPVGFMSQITDDRMKLLRATSKSHG